MGSEQGSYAARKQHRLADIARQPPVQLGQMLHDANVLGNLGVCFVGLKGEHLHTGRDAGLDSGKAILDHDAGASLDTHGARSMKEEAGLRFPSSYLVATED